LNFIIINGIDMNLIASSVEGDFKEIMVALKGTTYWFHD